MKRCAHCGVRSTGFFIPDHGCARGQDVDGRDMCASMEIDLLRNALRRALVPDAFDERARIKKGRLLDVLGAEKNALRQAAALRGPVRLDWGSIQDMTDDH